MQYVIRDIATHHIVLFNMLGKVIAFAPDASHHDRLLGRIGIFNSRAVAEHILEHTIANFTVGNIAAGRNLEVYPAHLSF